MCVVCACVCLCRRTFAELNIAPLLIVLLRNPEICQNCVEKTSVFKSSLGALTSVKLLVLIIITTTGKLLHLIMDN